MTTRQRLLQAMGIGEILDVLYFAGTQPGTVRKICPLSLSKDKVRALCLASNTEKLYFISKMDIIPADKATFYPSYVQELIYKKPKFCNYEMRGFSKFTGRKRVFRCKARTNDDAILQASRKGIIVDVNTIKITPIQYSPEFLSPHKKTKKGNFDFSIVIKADNPISDKETEKRLNKKRHPPSYLKYKTSKIISHCSRFFCFIPGIGHFCNRRWLGGVCWILVVFWGYHVYISFGLFLHIVCVLRAFAVKSD